MCGKIKVGLHDHHIIPWRFSHDDSESNIMRLCMSCHRKADAGFTNFILYGKINVSKDTHKRTSRRYHKKYTAVKTLYAVKLLKYAFYRDRVYYNINTGHITIFSEWRYDKRGTNIASGINIRKRLIKAVSVKGQTSLSGA